MDKFCVKAPGLCRLGNADDFYDGLALAVAMQLVDALFRLVADGGYLVGLDVGFDNFGLHFYLVDQRRTNTNVGSIDDQERFKSHLLVVTVQQLDFDGLAFGTQVLFATRLYDCFFPLSSSL